MKRVAKPQVRWFARRLAEHHEISSSRGHPGKPGKKSKFSALNPFDIAPAHRARCHDGVTSRAKLAEDTRGHVRTSEDAFVQLGGLAAPD
ncbi:hypothetical protein MAHJHV30_44150 [Mycobacterium avium subsp. hominissuis]